MVFLTAAWLLSSICVQDPDAVLLRRQFRVGDVEKFVLVKELDSEVQRGNLLSWIPNKWTVTQRYTMKTTGLQGAGTADLRLDYEKTKVHYGQFLDEGPHDDFEDPEFIVLFFSPTNEILKIYDMTPPKKKTPKSDPGDEEGGLYASRAGTGEAQARGGDFLSQVQRMVSFPGLMDFGPKLPYRKVKVGDTWHSTLDFLPGMAVGTDPSRRGNKSTRVDITYRYDGIKERNGKKFVQINGSFGAKLDLKTPLLADLPIQIRMRSPITKATIEVKGEMNFFLDPQTLKTNYAEANSTGDVQIDTTEAFTPIRLGMKLKGSATLKAEPLSPK